MSGYASVKGRAIRVTRLDAAGRVDGGDDASVTSRGFVQVSWKPDWDTGKGRQVRNIWGELCVMERVPDALVGVELKIDLCRIDPCVLDLMVGHPSVFDPHGVRVGDRLRDTLMDSWFALEVWTKALADDACDELWHYWLFPRVRAGHVDGDVVNQGMLIQSVSSTAVAASEFWRAGPYLPEPMEHGEVAFEGDFRTHVVTSTPPPPDSGGCEFLSVDPTVVDTVPSPQTPTRNPDHLVIDVQNLQALGRDGYIHVTWDAPSIGLPPDYTSWRYRVQGAVDWTDQGEVLTTAPHFFDITGLPNDVMFEVEGRYHYDAQTDPNGNMEPRWTMVEAMTTPPPPTLADPTGFVASPGDGQVSVLWDDPVDAVERWVLQRKLASEPDTAWAVVGELASVGFADTTVVNGETYDYRIRAAYDDAFWVAQGSQWVSSTGVRPIGTPTGAFPGTPGGWLPTGSTVPADLVELNALGALGQTTAWASGDYVPLGDATIAAWDGAAWAKPLVRVSFTQDPSSFEMTQTGGWGSATSVTMTVTGAKLAEVMGQINDGDTMRFQDLDGPGPEVDVVITSFSSTSFDFTIHCAPTDLSSLDGSSTVAVTLHP